MNKLISIGLMITSFSLFAQPAATVLSVADKVTASHNGTTRELSRGSSLEVGDSITTSSSGSARIKYSNGTLLSISPATNYTILSYSPTPGGVQIKAQLNYGTIKGKTSGITKETIKTPVVALAVLGTSYEITVSGGKLTKSRSLHKHTGTHR